MRLEDLQAGSHTDSEYRLGCLFDKNGNVLNRGKGLIGKEAECVFMELIGVGCKGLFRWRKDLLNRIDVNLYGLD